MIKFKSLIFSSISRNIKNKTIDIRALNKNKSIFISINLNNGHYTSNIKGSKYFAYDNEEQDIYFNYINERIELSKITTSNATSRKSRSL